MSVLSDLIRDPTATVDRIAAALDAMPSAERVAATRRLGRADQRRLWAKAEAAPPLSLAHFVPEDAPPLTSVRHLGRNTLPLTPRHRFFEKRFARPEAGGARLIGYNEAPAARWVGPGYFVAYETGGRPGWAERGAVVIDYFEAPEGPVPAGWPEPVDNARGLGRLVYGHTRDFMRRVSTHVSVGAAHKGERALDHYFVLCRV